MSLHAGKAWSVLDQPQIAVPAPPPLAHQPVLNAYREAVGHRHGRRFAARLVAGRLYHRPPLPLGRASQFARIAAEKYPAAREQREVAARLPDILDDVGGEDHDAVAPRGLPAGCGLSGKVRHELPNLAYMKALVVGDSVVGWCAVTFRGASSSVPGPGWRGISGQLPFREQRSLVGSSV